MLAKKDAEEQASLEELKVQARNELAEWYARHEEQLNQTKTLNRRVTCSLLQMLSSHVPSPIPSFSMFHDEKREGLVHEITCGDLLSIPVL